MKKELIKEIIEVSQDLRHNIQIENENRIKYLQSLLLNLVETLSNINQNDTKSTK